MTGYCAERTPSRDPRDHICRRQHGHRGSHACTCGHTWRFIPETRLPSVFPDLDTTATA